MSVVPAGVEPTFPGCKPGVVAIGPRDRQILLDADVTNARCWSSKAMARFLAMRPSTGAEGEGLEPPNDLRRRLFSRQVPHPAGCLPFSVLLILRIGNSLTKYSDQRSRLFINCAVAQTGWRPCRPTSCGGWNRTNIETFKASCPTVRRPRMISAWARVPCGSRTHLARCFDSRMINCSAGGPSVTWRISQVARASKKAWDLCRSVKGTRTRSSGGRNRTSNHRLNRPPPYRLATPDHLCVIPIFRRKAPSGSRTHTSCMASR